MTQQEMSQITNGHVAAGNNNNSNTSDEESSKVSFVGRCQGALIGAMERGCYRFGILVAK